MFSRICLNSNVNRHKINLQDWNFQMMAGGRILINLKKISSKRIQPLNLKKFGELKAQ